MIKRVSAFFLFTLLLTAPFFSFAHEGEEHAESREVEAIITLIESEYDTAGVPQVIFEAHSDDDHTYRVDTGESYLEGVRYSLEEGDRVILQILPNADGTESAFLTDLKRTSGLFWLVIVFAVVAIAIGLWRGLFALIGLAITLAVLFGYVFPSILAGSDPVVVTVIGCLIILAVNMHLSHGLSRKTLVAYAATVIGLGLAVVAAKISVAVAGLSGLASEEATLLYWQAQEMKTPVGLLLAGIILGATGVLDDIAITQSETVAELREANPQLSNRELFKRAMRVGRHHIASTVNTLVLAYAGVAMPLFLLFLMTPELSADRFINTELVAEEIVRTVSGTIALMLTVPIATALSAWVRLTASEATTTVTNTDARKQ